MGLETHSTVEIKERFHKENRSLPNMNWQYGTLWIDTEDTDDLRIIKEVMEDEVTYLQTIRLVYGMMIKQNL